MDYFLARYYSAAQGRFTSVDPLNIVLERQTGSDDDAEGRFTEYLADPRNWNRFTYVTNNPVLYVDPDGKERYLRPLRPQPHTEADRPGGTVDKLLVGGIVIAAGAVGIRNAPQIGAAILAWMARNPDKVQWIVNDLVKLSTGNPAGSLTVPIGTRLTKAEITTGLRLAEQQGLQLSQSKHIGAEFVDAAGKTYDAMGGKKAFKNFGSGKDFLQSIVRHVNKSVDYVVSDLKGASEAQIKAVKGFVSSLGKKQQERIIYVE